MICSTGSVLAPGEQFDYVYQNIKQDVQLSSISGGNGYLWLFAIGNPIGAKWRGECQVKALAMDVQVYNAEGEVITDQCGSLFAAIVSRINPSHLAKIKRREILQRLLEYLP